MRGVNSAYVSLAHLAFYLDEMVAVAVVVVAAAATEVLVVAV
jgi:hypothetical protein